MIRVVIYLLACAIFFGQGTVRAETASSSNPGWKVAARDGVSWLTDPGGDLFFSKGVNDVTPWEETEKSRLGQAYYWKNFYPSLDAWRGETGRRLREWGFNTLGGCPDPSPLLGLALTVDLSLGSYSRFHWGDPFDPAMDKTVQEWAVILTAPYRTRPGLIGYYSDNEIGWWGSPLFIWYLKADWESHTKRFLWELIYGHYDGDWEKLLKDWVPQGGAAGFEDLKRAGAALKLRSGGAGIRLVGRFMHECAKRYYELMFKAIHAAHPQALVLGDRFPLYYHQDAVLAIGDNVDVISTNYNIDTPDGWVAPYYFDGLRKLSFKPVLVTEFFFAAQENRSGNKNESAGKIYSNPAHFQTVATQAERAWGVGNALLNFARFPNVVGTHWFKFADEPLGGREDGEDYNLGLVDTSNRGYEEVTGSFSRLNPLLESIHRESARWSEARRPSQEPGPDRAASGGAVRIMRAGKIDVADQSLIDWEKEKTLLTGFTAPKPYAPFGDVHLAWSPEGLYLFCLANTYVDPKLLDYRGKFPYTEAFQLHLFAERAGTPLHYGVYLVLRDNPDRPPDGFEVVPELFRIEDGKMEPLDARGHVQRLDKSLPHMAVEAFFPARWLGADALQPGQRLRLNIAMASFFREFTMSWAGSPGEACLAAPDAYREVILSE